MGRLFICASLALLLSGCEKGSSPEKKGQELVLNLHSEPPSLDLRKANDTGSVSLLKMFYEGLTRIGSNGEPQLALAKEVKVSEDKKSFTFTLREATWSDGQPITAYDFVDTWRTILSPQFPSPFANDLYIIKNGKEAKEGKRPLEEVGVHALDSHTLHVELEHSVPFFLTLTACTYFFAVPSHINSNYPNWADNAGEHYVSNGPFVLKEWRHYNEILIEKNAKYWDADSVKLEKLSLPIIEDENTELSMFENGQLDWAGSPLSSLPIDALPALERKQNFHRYDMAGTYYYIFNTRLPPFNNANMRKAFSLAINRKDIVENVTQGGQRPAMALIPPSIWKHTYAYFRDGDKEEARRLFSLALQEMQITLDELPPITLIYNTAQGHHKIAQAIQQQWQEALGVKVSLENKEWKVYLDELGAGQFHVARMGGIASFSDPTTFLDLYKYLNSGQNYSGWTCPAFTELLERSDNTPNQVERLKLLQQAEEIFMNEMPLAPIYFYTGSYLKKPMVRSVYLTNLSDVDFKWAYVEGQ